MSGDISGQHGFNHRFIDGSNESGRISCIVRSKPKSRGYQQRADCRQILRVSVCGNISGQYRFNISLRDSPSSRVGMGRNVPGQYCFNHRLIDGCDIGRCVKHPGINSGLLQNSGSSGKCCNGGQISVNWLIGMGVSGYVSGQNCFNHRLVDGGDESGRVGCVVRSEPKGIGYHQRSDGCQISHQSPRCSGHIA